MGKRRFICCLFVTTALLTAGSVSGRCQAAPRPPVPPAELPLPKPDAAVLPSRPTPSDSVATSAEENGDVPSGQQSDPAPVESFTAPTSSVDPRPSEDDRKEIKPVRPELPLVTNDVVESVIAFLQKRGSGYVKTALKRIGRYQPLFEEELRKEGLPRDLVYLAAAESAFDPFALSRAGAKGIWQLMLGRAAEYGLKKDRWVDEREDPAKSTQVAVRHLRDLYQTFGDWYLVMAAYNCGPVAVQKAIEKTGYADFWILHRLHALPVDTENFVPAIIATALIAKSPRAYGFDIDPDQPEEADSAVVGVPTDLRLIAQLIDRPVQEVIRLNPGLLRWTTPANNPQYVLNLPRGTGPAFEEAIAAIPPDKRIWWRAHRVREGETLGSVSREFHISTAAVASANQLSKGAPLPEGTLLVLPLARGSEASLARVRERGSRRPLRYKVKGGDTLDRIADRFDVTPSQLRRWNKLSSSGLVEGQNLKIYVAAGAGRRTTHKPRGRRSAAAAVRAPASPSRVAPSGKTSSQAAQVVSRPPQQAGTLAQASR
ncbi:MAG: transglycosylase SLT domain-containing protein [Terriglobia bacterium]